MLAISGIYLCSQRLRFIERRLSVARGLCALIRYTKVQVENYAMPCSEILRRCPRETLSLCGYADEDAPADFVELCDALDVPDEECRRIFCAFAVDMGSSYRAEQVKRCEEFLTLMGEREEYIADKLPSERKLTVALFGSAVLAALILAL